MKKNSIRSNCRLLVEKILSENLVDANKILNKVLKEAQDKRERDIFDLITEQEEEAATDIDDAAASEEGGADAEGDTEGDTDADTAAAEPDDNDTDLGDDLEDAAGDEEDEDAENAVGDAKLTEMSNDQVELQCEINEKMISIYADKLANLKTQLNAMGLEKQEREYVTLETNISYYSKKLRELQDKCEITIDQAEVEERLNIIENAIKTLEEQIGGSSAESVPDVDSTDDLEGGEGEVEETESEEVEGEETEGEEVEEEEAEEEEEA